MLDDAVAELAPTGVLRVGINLANMLLVTGRAENGDPQGVAPDMAREIADTLGVALKYIPFDSPGETADGLTQGLTDICLIAAEPARAETIAFTNAYTEIEATYLVPAGSTLMSIADVDQAGVRIAVSARSAYDLYLDRTIQHAELVRAEGLKTTFEMFARDGLDALAGLRPALIKNAESVPGARILEGQFTSVQQAIGTQRENLAGAAFLANFVEEAKARGLVAELIDRHGVTGKLTVAPVA